MGINRSDVDGASKEGTEQALEVAVGREHDAFKTSQFGRPRKLYASSVSLEGVDDGHVYLEVGCRESVGGCKRGKKLVTRNDSEGLQ